MFEEGRLYAPVRSGADGEVVVELGEDHPGFADGDYRERRNLIARQALEWRPGAPVPEIAYSAEEQQVWRTVSRELGAKHERLACREYRDAIARLDLPRDRIPRLREVSQRLAPLTGFSYRPAAGLVGFEDFYGSLADGIFHSTQYLRHHAQPLYTPEPDLIHEVIGHGGLLASPRLAELAGASIPLTPMVHQMIDIGGLLGGPRLAELNRLAGRAARRLETPEGRRFFSSVFWYSIEFGVVWEARELRAYGAGLLSSYGEIEEFRDAGIRPLSIAEMGTLAYDITAYQPVLFAADSLEQLLDVVGSFFAECDDDSPARLGAVSQTQ